MSDIIQPGGDSEPIPDEIQKQQIQEARIQMGKANRLAKEFVKRMEKEFKPDVASFLSLLATTSCDMLAEALVTMDETGYHKIDEAIPMFTKRLIVQIEAAQARANDDKIVIARNTPPSRN